MSTPFADPLHPSEQASDRGDAVAPLDANTAAVAMPSSATCLDCGYPLAHLPEHRCPECGRAFEPGNRDTYRTWRAPPFVLRRLLRPPGWLTTVPVLAGSALVVLQAPPMGWNHAVTTAGLVLVMLIAAFWVAHMWMACILATHHGVHGAITLRSAARWTATPVIIGLMAVASGCDWPLRAAFVFSRTQLDGLVAAAAVSPQSVNGPQRVGYLSLNVTQSRGSVFVAEVVDVLADPTRPARPLPRLLVHVNGNGFRKSIEAVATPLGGGWYLRY